MSECKWTPGPWVVEYNLATGCNQVAAFEKSGNRCLQVTVNSHNRCQDEALIAAAPELYDALDELADLMQGVIEGDYKPDSLTLQVAKAALAKARGESR